MFCDACGKKDKILNSCEDTGQEGRNDGESDHFCTSRIPKETVKTITCDRGSEFSCRRDIEKALNCDMYSLIRIVHGKTIHHKICSLKISLTVALDLTIHPGVYVF